MKFCYDKNKKE